MQDFHSGLNWFNDQTPAPVLRQRILAFHHFELLSRQSVARHIPPSESLPQDFGVELGNRGTKIADLQDQFLALCAGLSGLRRKNPVAVNLLPVEKRIQKSKWTWAPTYVLLGANLLLLFSLIVRKPIQEQAYASHLSQEVSRLEPEVKKIRSVEDEIADLQRRTNLLTEFKKSNNQTLDALNELSKILPKNTWVSDFNMRNQTMEVYGASEAAAALPPSFREA